MSNTVEIKDAPGHLIKPMLAFFANHMISLGTMDCEFVLAMNAVVDGLPPQFSNLGFKVSIEIVDIDQEQQP